MSTTRIANKRSNRFSRVVASAPDGEKNTPLCQPENLIAGQSDSKVYRAVKKKRELFPGLPPTSPISLVLPLIIHVLVREY